VTRVVTALPEAPLTAAAEVAGELWYRASPARAAQARLNLRRVCEYLVATQPRLPRRVRAAATDDAALDRLVRSAFRHNARYYLEVVRSATFTPASIARRLDVETPATADEALTGRATIYVGLHFGAIELPAAYVADRLDVPVTIPMETIADPDLQAWFEETRGTTGVRIVPLDRAKPALRAALRNGKPVGLVGDRDLTGGGIAVELFGHPAKLPVGPGLLAIETGLPVYTASVRRTAHGRYSGRMHRVPVPADGTRRERLTGFLREEAAVFEQIVAAAPDQWWAVFFPIWPDLVVGEGPVPNVDEP
jgi:KDO2-lipid IV(A) lauroyltransferase